MMAEMSVFELSDYVSVMKLPLCLVCGWMNRSGGGTAVQRAAARFSLAASESAAPSHRINSR